MNRADKIMYNTLPEVKREDKLADLEEEPKTE
jgi:hypothetical protein